VTTLVQPVVELATLLRRGHAEVSAAIWDLLRAESGEGDVEVAHLDLAHLLMRLLSLSSLMGRRRVVMASARGDARGAATNDDGAALLIPRVSWKEAIDDLVTRYPTIVPREIRMLETARVQEWLGELYRKQGFALARTTRTVVSRRVQQVLQKGMRHDAGLSKRDILERMLSVAGEHGDEWTQGYAETVFRNNVGRAYTEGIHEQMRDPDVKTVIGALQFVAARDSDTTDICLAAHGTLAPAEHTVWDRRSPPLHHNCRSGLRFVNWVDLERMGALDKDGNVKPYIPNDGPSDPKPQAGFGGRRS